MSGLKDFVQNNVSSYLPQEDSSYGPNNWFYRRMVIMSALAVCGLSIVGISMVVVFGMAQVSWSGVTVTYDSNLLRLAEGIVWASLTFAGTVIGAYVFGSNSDTKDFRKNVLEMQSRGVTTITETRVVNTLASPPVDVGDQSDETKTNQTSGDATKGQEPAG